VGAVLDSAAVRPLPYLTFVTFLVFLAGACAGAATGLEVTSPFTEEDARVFGDGVDFIADPAGLEGPWYDSWHSEMEHRVKAADLIAAITVRTMRTDVDLDRRRTMRVVADVDDVVLGKAPGDEVVLVVREGQSGFASVEGNEKRILNQAFMAYIKWYRRDDGEVAAHWHLAPATPGIVSETTSLVKRYRKARPEEGQRRVIVHEH
jgi:hypothetical protein